MITTLRGVRVAGISSAVPAQVATASETGAQLGMSDSEIRKVVKMTGVAERRVAKAGLCTSDLAFHAASRLLDSLSWQRDSVDALVFVSQTHDYILPATACGLQHRLGLGTHCAALDISLGCSGYVYGLMVASSLVATSAKRVLLLAGDTISQICSPQDRSTAFLFGDAGTATALERDEHASPITFALGTDGAGQQFLIQRAGARRHPLESANLERVADENGNLRGPADLYMNGAEVFTFTLDSVPRLISTVLEAAHWNADQIDYFVPHQANQFMLEHLGKRAGLAREKMLLSLDRYGNSSVASIPLTITDKLAGKLGEQPANLLVAGFGVGWSWAAATLRLGPIPVLPVIEI